MKPDRFAPPLAAAALALLFALAPARADSPATKPATQPATRPADLSAQVLGVRITRDIPEQLRRSGFARSFDPNGQGGPTVQVLVMVRAADGKIVEADPNKLRIDTFLDDTYRDLRPAPDADQRRQYYGGQSGNLIEDGSAAAYLLSTDRAPAEGAERLLIRGSVTLKVAGAEKKSDKLPLTLRIGESIPLGKATLTVGSLSLSGGPMGTQVQLRSDQPLEAISDLFLFDAEGKPLKIPPGAQQSIQQSIRNGGGRNGNGPSYITFPVPQDLDKVQVQFAYAESVAERDVPFEVQVDLGTAKVGEKPEKPGPVPAAAPAATNKPQARGEGRHRFVRTVAEAVDPFGPKRARPDWPADPSRTVKFPPRREPVWPEKPDASAAPATRPAFAPRLPFPDAAPPVTLPPEVPNAEVQVLALATARGMGGAGDHTGVNATGWPINPVALFKPNGGTQVQLLLKVPGERIAAVGSADVRIDAFADDTGAALPVVQVPRSDGPDRFTVPLRNPGPFFRAGGTDVVTRLDGSAALFLVAMEAAPTPGATRLRLRGRVPVQLAGERRTVKGAAAPLRPGTKLAPADADFSAVVVEVRASTPPAVTPTVSDAVVAVHARGVPIGDVQVQVTFRTDLPPEQIATLKLADAEGDSVFYGVPRLYSRTPGVPGDPDSDGYVYAITTNAVPGPVTPEWTLLSPPRAATVPFDITTGLGL